MDILLQYFRVNFYIDVLSLLVALVALKKYFNKKRMQPSLKVFRLYFLAYVIIIVLIIINGMLALPSGKSVYPFYLIVFHLDFYFTILEFYVFAIYFKTHINKTIYKICSFFFISYSTIAYILFLILDKLYNNEVMLSVFTVQAVILITFCISYYVNCITKYTQANFLSESSFWIASGVLLFALSTLPFSLMLKHLLQC